MKFVYILRKNDDPNTYIGFTNNSIKMHLKHQHYCDNANNSSHNHRVWKHIREKWWVEVLDLSHIRKV